MPAIVWDAPADRVAAAPPAPAGPVESPVADTPGGPGVRRAARGRAMEPSGDSEDGEGDDGNSGGAAPDVDAIARKVYDLLRRRLAAERRRGF